MEMIQNFRAQLVAGDITFKELAEQESDCSSAKKGGDLGYFGKGQMQPSFEQAAFALQIGELSQAVESDSGMEFAEVSELLIFLGVHLILRTA